MDSAKFAGIVALGTAIGLALAMPEAERADMAAPAFVTIMMNAGFAAWAFALGRSIARMVNRSSAGR
jgi:hypothetical protein